LFPLLQQSSQAIGTFELRGLPNRWVTNRGLVVLRLLDAAGLGIVCRERHKKEVTTYLSVFSVVLMFLFLITIFAQLIVLGRLRRPCCFGSYLDRACPKVTVWVTSYPSILLFVRGQNSLYILFSCFYFVF
jgi:hypothetical protein